MATSKSKKSSNEIYIHEDIIVTQILPKLPPISLIRFKCVNKLYKSIISHPSFKISPEHITNALFLTPQTNITISNTNFSVPLCLENVFEQAPPASLPLFDEILGTCNGLLLLSKRDDILLWNPATRYCQKVLQFFSGHSHILGHMSCVVYGFCYDSLLDDYIVLLMLPRWKDRIIWASLKSKRWKRVIFPYHIDIASVKGRGYIVNNLLHFLASPTQHWTLFKNTITILYFDAPSNTFNELPLPAPGNSTLVGLGVMEQLLCLMRLDNRRRDNVEVLVMKEYGVKESWTPMFSIQDVVTPKDSLGLSMELVLCGFKFDVIIFRVCYHFYAYYPSTRRMEKLDIPPHLQHQQYWKIKMIPYVLSLDSPSGYYSSDDVTIQSFHIKDSLLQALGIINNN